jgi:hypothetical protein
VTRMSPIIMGEWTVARLVTVGRTMAELIQRPVAEPKFTVSGEIGNIITVGIQLKDRRGRDVVGRWPIDLWITTAADGAPSATGNTVAVVTGTLLATYTAHAAYRLLTDATGLAGITIEIAGAATRYVYATIGGESFPSAALTWAA